MLTKILQKEKLRDKQGNLITDPMELAQLQEITLAKKYPEKFYKYWKKEGISDDLSEVFGEFLLEYPKALSLVKEGKITLGPGSWNTIFASFKTEEVPAPYVELIDNIPPEYLEEILIADPENICFLAHTNYRETAYELLYENPHIDLYYLLKHCNKVEILHELLFWYFPNDDFMFDLVLKDPSFGEIIEAYSEYEFSVAQGLKLVRTHPQLITLGSIPVIAFNKAQWDSLTKLYPKDTRIRKIRKKCGM